MQNQTETARPHSKTGIASCLAGTAGFLISTALVLLFLNAPNVLFRMLFIVLVPILIHAVCLILCLKAAFSPNHKRAYPVLGAVLNGAFLTCGLVPWIYFLTQVKIRVL